MHQTCTLPTRRTAPPAAAPSAGPAADTGASGQRSPDAIADHIVNAILAGQLAAGQRLGEQALADLYGVSRTLVREALGRLSARGMVEVNARRGWFVVQPSAAEAKDAFDARIAIETGLVQALDGPLPAAAVRTLKAHVAEERAAIAAGDAGRRSYLLGEFHVCLAECAGNALLADILKDLTARTTLIASLFQSTHDAARSCADHAQIVAALAKGDHAWAARLVRTHIEEVALHLGQPAQDDPLAGLRSALPPAPLPRRGRLFSRLLPLGDGPPPDADAAGSPVTPAPVTPAAAATAGPAAAAVAKSAATAATAAATVNAAAATPAAPEPLPAGRPRVRQPSPPPATRRTR